LRADLTAHCLRLDLPFHHRHPPGVLIERIDGDVGQLARFFSQLVIQLLGNGLLLIGILVLLTGEDWRLGVGFLLFLAGALGILFRLRNFATPYLQAERAASADLFGFLEERLGGTEDIRANGAVAYTVQRLLGQMCELWRRSMAARPRSAIFGSIIAIWFEAGTVLALALGALLFLRGALTIGTVYLLYAYLRMASGPLLSLTSEIQHLQEATAAIARIGELFAEARTIIDGKGTPLPAGPLTVTFDHVHFGYGNGTAHEGDTPNAVAGASTLHDLSLTLPAGRTLGVLGRTGSGKTTITRLLLRFYDPQAGAVRLNEVDLRDLTLTTLRHHVSIVTQDVQLFNASVRDNLTFFEQHFSDEALVAALQKVGLGPWLQALPAGLDTPLRAGGGSLSAGEAQLLAFARVLLKDPGVVILDEASSRLDPATEQQLDGAIGALLQQRTAIVIAHRLATVQKVDDILILADGRIVEYGPRAALAADPNSHFAHLLRTGLPESEAHQ
jgi:ATP-binding cassette subfamily B protein